ncbi:unnamed protein product, partial [Cylicocyclus nassatus]
MYRSSSKRLGRKFFASFSKIMKIYRRSCAYEHIGFLRTHRNCEHFAIAKRCSS